MSLRGVHASRTWCPSITCLSPSQTRRHASMVHRYFRSRFWNWKRICKPQLLALTSYRRQPKIRLHDQHGHLLQFPGPGGQCPLKSSSSVSACNMRAPSSFLTLSSTSGHHWATCLLSLKCSTFGVDCPTLVWHIFTQLAEQVCAWWTPWSAVAPPPEVLGPASEGKRIWPLSVGPVASSSATPRYSMKEAFYMSSLASPPSL